jgi:hypothetical protein
MSHTEHQSASGEPTSAGAEVDAVPPPRPITHEAA